MSVKGIDSKTAESLLAEQACRVIDVRKINAYREGRLPGALSVPLDEFPAFVETLKGDMVTPVLLYCYAGISSLKAAEYLDQMGFSNVYNLDGGFNDWSGQVETN